MEELMVKIEKMDFEKQQLEAEKIELTEKRNSLQKDLLEAQKELAIAKVFTICGWMVAFSCRAGGLLLIWLWFLAFKKPLLFFCCSCRCFAVVVFLLSLLNVVSLLLFRCRCCATYLPNSTT